MNDLETVIWTACREADEAFEKDGAAGTKEWIREYFLPSLERHGLKISLKQEKPPPAPKPSSGTPSAAP